MLCCCWPRSSIAVKVMAGSLSLGGVVLLSLRTPYALNRMLPRLLRNIMLPRKGLRADEESDDEQYVQRPPLGWLVSRGSYHQPSLSSIITSVRRRVCSSRAACAKAMTSAPRSWASAALRIARRWRMALP